MRESDWKRFRKLREAALERFCERALHRVADLSRDDERSFHARYLDVYSCIQREDRELADMFNGARRSIADEQLALMCAAGLVSVSELQEFSEGEHGHPPHVRSPGLDRMTTSVTAIHHVQLAMPAGEEAAARAFYGDLLGIPEAPKPAPLAGRGGVWFERGALRIHLGVEDDFRPARKAHPALQVTDLAALASTLRAAGVSIVEDDRLPGHARMYVFDPFGNRIELLEPTP